MKRSRISIIYVICGSLSLLFLVSACGGGGEENPFAVESEIVTSADRPIALALAPDGRLFYVEHRLGNVRVVSADGDLLAAPFAQVATIGGIDWGLTGLALDPDFETNSYVYVYFTELVGADPGVVPGAQGEFEVDVVVMRFTDRDNQGVDPKVIVEDLPEPEAQYNANGSIHFGPDGFLYLTLGDLDVSARIGPTGESLPLDLGIAAGKMLRVDKEDGSAAADNPFVDDPEADPRIFAFGFRQNFHFVFHPETGQIYGHDNTPVSCEELNVVEEAGNYGWPDVGEFPWPDCQAGPGTKGIHFLSQEELEPENFLSPVGVSGMEFVSADVYPLIGDSLLICESQTKLMRRLVLRGADPERVIEDDVVVDDCDMDIAVSSDGIIYYSNVEEIRRLIPLEVEVEVEEES